jgi:truncated hemoglobin YjbI/quinol monooxygenase YgiN
MSVEYISYGISRGRAMGFRRAYAEAAAILQADPRCLSYEVSQSLVEPTRFVVRIEWDSTHTQLADLRADPTFADFFTLVSPYAAEILEIHTCEIHVVSPDLPEKGLPSLYEWAGGRAGVTRLIHAFYDRVEQDELLAPFFPGGVRPDHRAHVTAWWSEVLGGPAQYTEMGGYPRMLAHHLDLNITPQQRRRFVLLLSIAADDAGLPDDPEFRAAMLGYAEWATRLAMHNSHTGANVVREAPVPRWGWGVAPPYVG